MANSVDTDQTAPIGAVCSGSTLFASIPYLSVMLGNNLQQTTSADDIFRVQCFKGYFSSSFQLYFSVRKWCIFCQLRHHLSIYWLSSRTAEILRIICVWCKTVNG